jgi:hypothetical protein
VSWDAPLIRVLSPKGTRLVTLRDAGAYLSERFPGVTESAVLKHGLIPYAAKVPGHRKGAAEAGPRT